MRACVCMCVCVYVRVCGACVHAHVCVIVCVCRHKCMCDKSACVCGSVCLCGTGQGLVMSLKPLRVRRPARPAQATPPRQLSVSQLHQLGDFRPPIAARVISRSLNQRIEYLATLPACSWVKAGVFYVVCMYLHTPTATTTAMLAILAQGSSLASTKTWQLQSFSLP